ncbi:hypothetical protein [Actinokineospora sp. NBRC 105648]|uniref:hypothetical protein n=1 Tax=Actinokineospora sp. NBRC 105648 TaxID=3032206 RepID=UPI0024A5919B|nr:hypothetical protein [Actinokineospora sp. NBRC 105648]GLZ43726.1 hypothetical protein Acsp05_73500 [Actinokineospora sp. NBRC 105648]
MTTTTICACDCGRPVTAPRSSYAGETEAERNQHRARAAYLRKTQEARRSDRTGTREALAALGLADDVPVTQLAEVLSTAARELARRVEGLDSAAVLRQIEEATAGERARADEAEQIATQAREDRLRMAHELEGAVERAVQADDDAAAAEVARAEQETRADKLSREIAAADRRQAEAEARAEAAERDRDQARTKVEVQAAEHTRLIEEIRRSAEVDQALQLANQRQAHTEALGKVRDDHQAAMADLRRKLAEAEHQTAGAQDRITWLTSENERREALIEELKEQTTRFALERDDAEGRALRAGWEIERLTERLEQLEPKTPSTAKPTGGGTKPSSGRRPAQQQEDKRD